MTGTAPPSLLAMAELDGERIEKIISKALAGADDGELFLEYRQSESLNFDDGRLKAAATDTAQGFGLRAVAGDATAYAHGSDLSEAAIAPAGQTVAQVARGYGGTLAGPPPGTNQVLYGPENPLEAPDFAEKVALLSQIDAFARARDPRIKQVSASLAGSWQVVEILRPGGLVVRDVRPLVRLNVSVVAEVADRRESGSRGSGGREGYSAFISPDAWQDLVTGAVEMALVNLDSVPAPAGDMDVVLGPGWPGILLHEAVGHGLEGDFNRKGVGAFAGLIGQRVASPGVTVVDDGTIASRRGSLTIDDEGTPTNTTTLIEDGILVRFMQDRQNARLMGAEPTGNGRRQSYAHQPMPRMTNTYMLAGTAEPEEIIASVKNGLYAVSFGGGQVDTTNGEFAFSCTEAYKIEDGRIGAPVKGATLIGNGADALTRISMIGNDMALDTGIGTCGKQGQSVPVGVGQPSLRIDGLTVGGTAR
ncbi:MAG: metalloprotease TldD [Hyphomicrobiales bacterium]